MSYTVSKVRNSTPDVLLTASSDATTSAQRVEDQIVAGARQFADLEQDWIGKASDAAGKQYGELTVDQVAYRESLTTLSGVLKTHGDKLIEFRSDLDSAVNNAEDWWNVADDGSVTPGFWLRWYMDVNDVDAVRLEAQRLEIENNIKLLLAQFEAQDLAAGYEIRQLGRELS